MWFRDNCAGCSARQGEVGYLRDQVRHLTDELLRMKREGFAPMPAAQLDPVDLTPPLPPTVQEAVDAMAGHDPKLYATLYDYALQELAADGVDSEDVADRIYAGGDSLAPRRR